MLYRRQVPNLSQTNLNEIYASQTASIERDGHPGVNFFTLKRAQSRRVPHMGSVRIFVGAQVDKVEFTPKCGNFADIGRHSNNCIFKLIEPIISPDLHPNSTGL